MLFRAVPLACGAAKSDEGRGGQGELSLFGHLNDDESALVTAADARFDASGVRSCGTPGSC